jgi:PAS domain S-box-containing protein
MEIETSEMIASENILNQVSDLMIILDVNDNIIFFNNITLKYQHLFKTHFQKGTHFISAIPAERQEIVKTIIDQVRKNRKPLTSEAEYHDSPGRAYFFEVTYNPIITESDKVEQICIVAREISHQKTFERKSVQLIQELSNLIENANALIFSVDSRQYITEWNKECIRVTGNEKNEVFARQIYNYLDDKSQEDFQRLMKKVLTGEPVSNQELLVKNKTGDITTVLMNATPKFNSVHNVIGVVLVGQDVTELSEYRKSLEEKVKDRTEKLKQALEKEKELVEIKNRFVSVASHEFRIPLSSIGGYVKAIKSNPHLREIDMVNFDAIEIQITHMKKLLDDILTIKKDETNTLKARYQPIELVGFLKKMADEVLGNANHSHRIVASFSKPSLEFESDEKLLRNISLNLLSNAIKFSPGQTEIMMSVTQADGQIEIKVQDRGIGITDEDLIKIFEPFHRGSNVLNIKGTGLGLYIVKKAVDTLEGTMEINSGVNAGTTITIKLPVK